MLFTFWINCMLSFWKLTLVPFTDCGTVQPLVYVRCWCESHFCCEQLLTKAPNARLGCGVTSGEEREIKDHIFYRNVNWQKMENLEVQPPFKPKVVSIISDVLYTIWTICYCMQVWFCFYHCLWLFLFVHQISRERLNGFVPNSQQRRVWTLARTSLNVKIIIKVTMDKAGKTAASSPLTVHCKVCAIHCKWRASGDSTIPWLTGVHSDRNFWQLVCSVCLVKPV